MEPQRPRGDPRLAERFPSPLSLEGRAAPALGMSDSSSLTVGGATLSGTVQGFFLAQKRAEEEAGGRACSSLVDLLIAACVDGWPGWQAVR